MVPGAGLEPAWPRPRDFKSLVSTSFTTRAGGREDVRVYEESTPSSAAPVGMEAEVGIEPAYTALQAAA